MTAAPGPNGTTCGSCRSWGGRPDGLAHKRGSPFPCRRHAPFPSGSGGPGFSTAHTPQHYWCGEHQPDTTETTR